MSLSDIDLAIGKGSRSNKSANGNLKGKWKYHRPFQTIELELFRNGDFTFSSGSWMRSSYSTGKWIRELATYAS
ncbi:hypothetical protein [Pollutibacter soli]|uniref:hypothetical protein n=1 Tax=Pollutibacter soli TaxID=3034157 RepID=UPI003013A409